MSVTLTRLCPMNAAPNSPARLSDLVQHTATRAVDNESNMHLSSIVVICIFSGFIVSSQFGDLYMQYRRKPQSAWVYLKSPWGGAYFCALSVALIFTAVLICHIASKVNEPIAMRLHLALLYGLSTFVGLSNLVSFPWAVIKITLMLDRL